jgi:hypothetical protein
MSTLNEPSEELIARAAFIETLSDEFIALTGFGVYAYLNPLEINRLFHQYLKQALSLRQFVRSCVRQTYAL